MIRAEQILGAERAQTMVERFEGLKRLATLEQVLAAVFVLIPLGLIVADSGTVRSSISHYYDMVENEWFYVPLTAAALLLIINGVVKDGRFYNWILGLALFVVLMFDHEGGSGTVHAIAAILFFAGNVAVMIFYADTDLERRLRWPLVGVLVGAMAAWYFADWFTLFWAEWLSLIVIAAHFFINSGQSRDAAV